MNAGERASPITPVLLIGLGDLGGEVVQALHSEVEDAPPVVQAAVCRRILTWMASGALQVTDPAGHILLAADSDGGAGLCAADNAKTETHAPTSGDDPTASGGNALDVANDGEPAAAPGEPDPWPHVRDLLDEALRALGSHATYERLVQAGYGSPDDSASSRPPRCYVVGALAEPAVAECLVPLLAQFNALQRPGSGPPPVAAFLSLATMSLDPSAPQRDTVNAALRALGEVIADPTPGGVWPCVLIDWVKAGGVLAENEAELRAALVALLRVLILADEPATLLSEVLSKPPIQAPNALFCSVGVSVIQSPPHKTVVEWLGARLMAEFLSRRCLNPLPTPPEWRAEPRDWTRQLELRRQLKALVQNTGLSVSSDLCLRVPAFEETRKEPFDTLEQAASRVRETLVGQIERGRTALHAALFESKPPGALPLALAEELKPGPHRLPTAQDHLQAARERLDLGQETLTPRLAGWPLVHDRNDDRVEQSQVALRAVRETVPSTLALFFRTLVLALLWGSFFGTWAGRMWGAGEQAGAALAALAFVAAVLVWRLAIVERQVRRARAACVDAILERERAQVEHAWLEAGQATLERACAWHAQQAKRMQTLRKRLARIQSALAEHEPQRPPEPIIVETLPYLNGYADWLRPEIDRDPSMSTVQQHLEGAPGMSVWAQLPEGPLRKALVRVGARSFTHVPALSAETVLVARGPDEVREHMERLRQLALPLINLGRTALPAETGSPSTLDLVCWEHKAAMRLDHWPDHRWQASTHVAGTGDPRRVTFVRILPAFGLEDLAEDLTGRSQTCQVLTNDT